MKAQAWLGVLEKSTADNYLLVAHFVQSGAMMLHLDLTGVKPRVLQFSFIKSDPSMTEQEKKNGFLDFLSHLKTKKFPPVALTWPEGMTFRQLEMSSMPPEDLVKAIEWDLKKKYYFNPEENSLGFSEVMDIETAEGPEKLFNIFYCEKNATFTRLSFMQELGLEIRSVIPSQAALSSFVWEAEPSPENDILVCERDGTFVRILVSRASRSMLVRQVTLIPQESNVTDEILKKIADEIKKTVDFYESQKYSRPIAKAVLMGAWEDEERVRAFLGQQMEIKVERLDMGSYFSETLGLEDKEFMKNNGGFFAASLGAVLLKDESMNLVPTDIKSKNRERRLQRWVNLALLGVGSLLFLVVIGISMGAQLIKKQMQVLEKEHGEISQKKKIFEDILGLEQVRRTIFRGEVYSPSLLKELSYRTPAIITLNEMQYIRQEGTCILRGEIPDSARENVKSVTQYAANLNESPFFMSVSVANTNHDEEKKVLQFELNCVVRGLL